MDTGSTDHICRESNLFVEKILPCPKISIKGIGGQLNASGYGTIKFKIVDDHGKTHEMLVHNVLHVPNSPVNLFSPQKFARDNESDGISGTCFLTGGTNSHFIWNNSKYIKTIHHPLEESLPVLHVNEGFNAMAMFNNFGNPMICTVCKDDPSRPVSFDESGDEVIPSTPFNSVVVPNGPAVIDDVPDDASEGSLEIRPLSLNDVSNEFDPLPNVEEDVDEVVSVEGSDDDNVVDISAIDLDEEEIPQLHASDLERLKTAMTAPLSPSQNEFLQWHVRLQHLPFPRMK